MRSSRGCDVLRQAALWLFFAALGAISLQAQKIKVEYDKSLDFARFKTFAWGQHDTVSRPMLAHAIAGAIEEELTKRGLHKIDNHPDLYIYSGYSGIPPFDQSFLVWGTVPGTTTTVVVHKGQLVVDLIDAAHKKIAWRGMAKENLSDNRGKLVDQVNTAVEKMFEKYPAGIAR
jgi:Domain of unknown function (DUF4136)